MSIGIKQFMNLFSTPWVYYIWRRDIPPSLSTAAGSVSSRGTISGDSNCPLAGDRDEDEDGIGERHL